MGLKVIRQYATIKSEFVFPNNYERLHAMYPSLVNKKNVDRAAGRAFSKKDNLVVIASENLFIFTFEGYKYEIHQERPVMLDGASSPIRIGDIGNFGSHLARAYYVHDLLYGIFSDKVKRKTADKIYNAFLKKDGCRPFSRRIQYRSLRLFGGKAFNKRPERHWNYGRAKLVVTKVGDK